MKTDDFDYELPGDLIAQHPLADRPSSKLLIVDKTKRSFTDAHFFDVAEYLNPGDVIVMNDSRVIRARLFGVKADTGAKIELLLNRKLSPTDWQVLAKPAKRLKEGTRIIFSDELSAMVIRKDKGLTLDVSFSFESDFFEIIERVGQIPVPPYIKEMLSDKGRYQTVFAKDPGSAAAPTAGFHMNKALMETLRKKGVLFAPITLHVGLGTFLPVSAETIEDHHMHEEIFEVSPQTAEIVNCAKRNGGRVIALGTTSVRTLESAADDSGILHAVSSSTDIFIYPDYRFKIVDALITNFHLPKSTLIMLVSAFADKDLIFKAYSHAIEEKYRFYSFGDAMLLY